MSLLSFVLPSWAKYAAIAVACLALVAFGFVKGDEHGTKKLITYQEQQHLASMKVVVRQGAVTEKIVTKYQTITKTVKEKGDVITQQVPVFIDKKQDESCFVSNGVRIVHDAAASNEIPAPPGPHNGESSGLTLSTTLGTVTQNYAVYHEVATRLTACQEWIRGQYKATNGEELK